MKIRKIQETYEGRNMAGSRIVLIVVLTVFGFSATADAQGLKKIRIGYPSLSFRQSNVWVAKEMGLFNKYGLEVEPIFLRGGQMATQALVAGDPPIVNIGTVVQASLRGHNLVLVAAVENNYDQIVFARPNIKNWSSSRGSPSVSAALAQRLITPRPFWSNI